MTKAASTVHNSNKQKLFLETVIIYHYAALYTPCILSHRILKYTRVEI